MFWRFARSKKRNPGWYLKLCCFFEHESKLLFEHYSIAHSLSFKVTPTGSAECRPMRKCMVCSVCSVTISRWTKAPNEARETLMCVPSLPACLLTSLLRLGITVSTSILSATSIFSVIPILSVTLSRWYLHVPD